MCSRMRARRTNARYDDEWIYKFLYIYTFYTSISSGWHHLSSSLSIWPLLFLHFTFLSFKKKKKRKKRFILEPPKAETEQRKIKNTAQLSVFRLCWCVRQSAIVVDVVVYAICVRKQMCLYSRLLHIHFKLRRGFAARTLYSVEYNERGWRCWRMRASGNTYTSIELDTHVMTMTLGWLVESYPTVFVIRRYGAEAWREVKCPTRNADASLIGARACWMDGLLSALWCAFG